MGPVSADPPRGCREGFGEHLEEFVLLVGPQGRMCSVTVMAGTRTSCQNVAMGRSVNVFKMKKGRINPNY